MLRAIRLDVTTVLLWGGALVLLHTLRSPYSAAEALAEGERQALFLVRCLAAIESGPAALAAPGHPGSVQRLIDELHERCRDAGLPRAAWPRPAAVERSDGICLQTPDWMLLLAATPPLPGAGDPDATATAREAWVWPRHEEARFLVVFCVRDGQTVTARNLTRRYLGPQHAPAPGGWRPRAREGGAEYWGIDGQYWRPHP